MAVELIETLLFNSYQFLASIKVPGFDISFIQLMFGATGALLSIAFLRMFFGLGNSSVNAGGIVSGISHGGNNRKVKISEKRKGDQK